MTKSGNEASMREAEASNMDDSTEVAVRLMRARGPRPPPDGRRVIHAKILVADDDAEARDGLATILGNRGFEVVAVDDGPSALAAADRHHPDVVLTDLLMPGMDGIELCRRLRERDPRLPVVLTTAYGDVESAARGMRAGASDYLTKPLDFDELLATVTRCVERGAEEALREAREMFRLTFEHAPIGMALVGLDGRLIRTNRQLRESLGYTENELSERSLHDLALPEDAEKDVSPMAALVRGDIPRFELPLRYQTKDGRPLDVVIHASLLRGDDGEPRTFVLQVEDVTERKRLDAQLTISERMASLGTLASGIAHEINNPLAYVMANLELADRELDSPPPAGIDPVALRPLIEESRDGAERIRKIVRGLITFGRATPEATGERIDVHVALNSAAGMAFNAVRHRARLVKDYGTVPLVVADESKLVQVFVNLIVNAAQAIAEGDSENNEVRLRTHTDADGTCVIEVHDTGAGIAQENLGRIFDPFFSTKEVGAGTGLGLSISHSIVASLGGTVSVTSELGRGSTFRVSLPAAAVDRAVVRPHESGPVESMRPRRGRVLVIDDDVALARSIAKGLGEEWDCSAVGSGREALARIAHGERFDAIVSDVMMPDLSGPALHAAIEREAPDLSRRMIFMSGGVFTPGTQAALDALPHLRIEKPFKSAALRELVLGLIQRGEAEGDSTDNPVTTRGA